MRVTTAHPPREVVHLILQYLYFLDLQFASNDLLDRYNHLFDEDGPCFVTEVGSTNREKGWIRVTHVSSVAARCPVSSTRRERALCLSVLQYRQSPYFHRNCTRYATDRSPLSCIRSLSFRRMSSTVCANSWASVTSGTLFSVETKLVTSNEHP